MLLIALIAVPAAAAGLPLGGVLVPGRSLGGVAVGARAADVRATWGSSFGVCSDCAVRTWYFNYKDFEPKGAGVAFAHSRVAAVFTLWSPDGWRTTKGLKLGDSLARLTLAYGPVPRTRCRGYVAYTLGRRAARVVTDFYVVGAHLWGFGLRAKSLSPCR